MTDAFCGFGAEGVAFLNQLAITNTREFFTAHKSTYDQHLAAPMRELVLEVGEELRDTVSPGIDFDPRVGKSLFRINRDLRFSSDKTPYHPWVDAVWWEGTDARRSPSFIFRLAGDHMVLGCGVMGLRNEALGRLRRAVADPTTGLSLENALASVRSHEEGIELSAPTRKRVPAPYPRDHPRAELLLLDSIHLTRRLSNPSLATQSTFATWLAGQFATFTPLHQWLVAHCAEPTV